VAFLPAAELSGLSCRAAEAAIRCSAKVGSSCYLAEMDLGEEIVRREVYRSCCYDDGREKQSAEQLEHGGTFCHYVGGMFTFGAISCVKIPSPALWESFPEK